MILLEINCRNILNKTLEFWNLVGTYKPDVIIICTVTGPEYRLILSVLDPRKCEYLKDYSLDFEHAYMTTYLAS